MYGLFFQITYVEIFTILTILGGIMKILKMMIDFVYQIRKDNLIIESMKLDNAIKKYKLKKIKKIIK